MRPEKIMFVSGGKEKMKKLQIYKEEKILMNGNSSSMVLLKNLLNLLFIIWSKILTWTRSEWNLEKPLE